MALTPEQIKELADYAAEDAAEALAQIEGEELQHLAAQRLRRSIAKTKSWKHGEDFVVLETDREFVNLAVRRPTEAEVEMIADKVDDPAAQEAYVVSLVVEPDAETFTKLKIKYPGIGGAVANASSALMGGLRVANAKK